MWFELVRSKPFAVFAGAVLLVLLYPPFDSVATAAGLTGFDGFRPLFRPGTSTSINWSMLSVELLLLAWLLVVWHTRRRFVAVGFLVAVLIGGLYNYDGQRPLQSFAQPGGYSDGSGPLEREP